MFVREEAKNIRKAECNLIKTYRVRVFRGKMLEKDVDEERKRKINIKSEN